MLEEARRVVVLDDMVRTTCLSPSISIRIVALSSLSSTSLLLGTIQREWTVLVCAVSAEEESPKPAHTKQYDLFVYVYTCVCPYTYTYIYIYISYYTYIYNILYIYMYIIDRKSVGRERVFTFV